MILNRQIGAAIIASLLCGCGTIGNRVSVSYKESGEDPFGGYAYGGTRFDVKTASFAFSKEPDLPAPQRLFASLFLLDVPVSAIFDTLLLPVTIPEEYRRTHVNPPAQNPDGKAESN